MPSAGAISTVLVRPLVAALEPLPRALDEFFQATDLTPQTVADAEARVTPSQFCIAWAEALRLSKRTDLALAMAESTPPGAFGIVEYVCRASPSLGEALRQWVRYLNLLDDAVEVALVETGKLAALRVVVESEAPSSASHELCFALVLKQAQAAARDAIALEAVRFTHRVPPRLHQRYREFFGAEVQFGAPRTELVFARGALEVPLQTADANLLAILVPAAEEKRARRPKAPPVTEQVRRALRGALSSADAQLETVARTLGLTPRSLQRRLKDEGVAFGTLRDETRQRLADHYLGQGLSLAEISFLLGFSEPSAFFRAFKRWTGLTPLEHRARLAPVRAIVFP